MLPAELKFMHSGRRTVNQPPQACETEASIQTFPTWLLLPSLQTFALAALPVIRLAMSHEWVPAARWLLWTS